MEITAEDDWQPAIVSRG